MTLHQHINHGGGKIIKGSKPGGISTRMSLLRCVLSGGVLNP